MNSDQQSALSSQRSEIDMKDFRKLNVWDKAHHLTLDIYNATASFPKEEMYGLTSQIRRAAASIGEHCRRLWKEFKRRLFSFFA